MGIKKFIVSIITLLEFTKKPSLPGTALFISQCPIKKSKIDI